MGALAVIIIGVVAFVDTGIVIIGIVVTVRVVIVRIPGIVWIESDVIDEPETIGEMATVPMPPMVVIAIPITVPIGRVPREDMVARRVRATVFDATVARSSCALMTSR